MCNLPYSNILEYTLLYYILLLYRIVLYFPLVCKTILASGSPKDHNFHFSYFTNMLGLTSCATKLFLASALFLNVNAKTVSELLAIYSFSILWYFYMPENVS